MLSSKHDIPAHCCSSPDQMTCSTQTHYVRSGLALQQSVRLRLLSAFQMRRPIHTSQLKAVIPTEPVCLSPSWEVAIKWRGTGLCTQMHVNLQNPWQIVGRCWNPDGWLQAIADANIKALRIQPTQQAPGETRNERPRLSIVDRQCSDRSHSHAECQQTSCVG